MTSKKATNSLLYVIGDYDVMPAPDSISQGSDMVRNNIRF